MSTDAQINANRLNSLKSTGPKTPEGKARSSLNALKSGIDAACNLIPGEDPAELAALTAQFLDHFQPADPNQLSLVDTLVFAEWTQRRLRRIEAELWRSHVEHHVEQMDDGTQQDFPRGYSHQRIIDPFTRIGRRVDSTNRLYLRTLKALRTSSPLPQSPCPLNHLLPKLASFRNPSPNHPNRPTRATKTPKRRSDSTFAHSKSQILNPKSRRYTDNK